MNVYNKINNDIPHQAIRRLYKEDPLLHRSDYHRDRDRIMHSVAFRRLANKTQVFTSDKGDHYRNRLTHTLEVSQIARSLNLFIGGNEPLTEANSLSHGQKQWLEIAMLLSQDCNLLMLDEPVAGMTDEETEKTSKLFRKISKERSLIVIEHDIDFVQSLKCPVTVLHEGAVLAQGNMKDLKKNDSVIEVYLGR